MPPERTTRSCRPRGQSGRCGVYEGLGPLRLSLSSEDMKTLLIAADVDRSLRDRAEEDGRFAVTQTPVRTEAELAAIVGDAEVLVTRAYNKVTRKVIEAAPRLELVAQATSGIDNIDAAAARERGI